MTKTAYLLIHEANEAADSCTPCYPPGSWTFAADDVLQLIALKIQIGSLPQTSHPQLDLFFSLDDVSPPVVTLANCAIAWLPSSSIRTFAFGWNLIPATMMRCCPCYRMFSPKVVLPIATPVNRRMTTQTSISGLNLAVDLTMDPPPL